MSYTLDDQITLKNLVGAIDPNTLERDVAEYVAARRLEIADGFGPQPTFDVDYLKALHQYLFQDVFEWAGHFRNERFKLSDGTIAVDPTIRKVGGKSFAEGKEIDRDLAALMAGLKEKDHLRGLDRDEFAKEAAHLLGALNSAHPFREGNGRTQREFITALAVQAGHHIEFDVISSERMTAASIASHEQRDMQPMLRMFAEITDPRRVQALESVIQVFEQHLPRKESHVSSWDHLYIATTEPGRQYNGKFAGTDGVTFMLQEPGGLAILVGNAADLPRPLPERGDTISIVATALGESRVTTNSRILVPAVTRSDHVSTNELIGRLTADKTFAESERKLEATAKAVFADWQPIADMVKTSAIKGKGGEELIATLRNQPESLGSLVGKAGVFTSKERHKALAARPLLAAAANHHIRLAASIRKTAEQEKYNEARRAKVEIKKPSHELATAIAEGVSLSGELKNELHQLQSAFSERFGGDLPHLRNARDLEPLAAKTGVLSSQLNEARNVLVQLDKGAAREFAMEQNIERGNYLSR